MKVIVSRNLYIIMAADTLLLCLSFFGAHLLRFDFSIPGHIDANLWQLVPWVIGIKLVCFYFFDLYRGMWRYTGLNDLFNVVKAMTLATVISVAMILYMNRFEGVSRSVLVIDWFFSVFLVGTLRDLNPYSV